MGGKRNRVNRIKDASGKGDVILNKRSELIGNVACEQRLGRHKELAMAYLEKEHCKQMEQTTLRAHGVYVLSSRNTQKALLARTP